MARVGMTAGEVDELIAVYLRGDSAGYLYGFSYSEHEDFYVRYCDLPGIDVVGQRAVHTSTRLTFRAILEAATPRDQAKILRGVFEKLPVDGFADDEHRYKAGQRLLRVAERLEGLVVPGPKVVTSDTVQHALANAEQLLRSSGPVSAVDRAHTALHGHLKHLCQSAGIVPEKTDPTATNYLTALVKAHPKLQLVGAQREEMKAVLRSCAAILTAIGNVRNNASLAHANDTLLDVNDAMLVINVTRSLLTYLDAKLRS